MYHGALDEVSNRETWVQSFTLTTDSGPIDLTGAVVTIGMRASESEASMPRVTYTSGDGKLSILAPATNGVFMISADLDPSTFPAGDYEVGVMIKLTSGIKRTIIVATLPIVDGVVTSS